MCNSFTRACRRAGSHPAVRSPRAIRRRPAPHDQRRFGDPSRTVGRASADAARREPARRLEGPGQGRARRGDQRDRAVRRRSQLPQPRGCALHGRRVVQDAPGLPRRVGGDRQAGIRHGRAALLHGAARRPREDRRRQGRQCGGDPRQRLCDPQPRALHRGRLRLAARRARHDAAAPRAPASAGPRGWPPTRRRATTRAIRAATTTRAT